MQSSCSLTPFLILSHNAPTSLLSGGGGIQTISILTMLLTEDKISLHKGSVTKKSRCDLMSKIPNTVPGTFVISVNSDKNNILITGLCCWWFSALPLSNNVMVRANPFPFYKYNRNPHNRSSLSGYTRISFMPSLPLDHCSVLYDLQVLQRWAGC